MSAIIVRFPDGDKEFRYPEKLPVQGDILWHDSEPYRVVSVIEEGTDRATVVVESASPSLADTLQSEAGGVVLEEILA